MRKAIEGVSAVLAHSFAWLAHSEQIWFPLASTYVRHISEAYGLPDFRGPFIFLTLVYVGFRIGDLWQKRDQLEETV